MDTIVYVCCDRNDRAELRMPPYSIKAVPVQDYRLIKINFVNLYGFPTKPALPRKSRLGNFFGRAYLKERRRKKELAKTTAMLRKELAAQIDERGENYVVAATGMPQRDLACNLIPLPEFDRYLDQNWVRRLLDHAVHAHFLVLGNVPYLPELFRFLARRMKSLVWILPDHYYAEMMEDFAEDFYQEYGLAIHMTFLKADETYGHIRIADGMFREPVNILDFTQGRCIPHMEPPQGSVWLDMASVEEKEKKLAARRLNVTYFSLKKQWEEL